MREVRSLPLGFRGRIWTALPRQAAHNDSLAALQDPRDAPEAQQPAAPSGAASGGGSGGGWPAMLTAGGECNTGRRRACMQMHQILVRVM